MTGRLWAGTSGYSYADWKNGVFYPPKLPQSRWFEHYCTQFSTVELNITFYRLPKPGVFKNWHAASPADFRFFVKGSRFITHLKRLKDPSAPLAKFFGAVRPLRDKLAGILWQLPPHFKADPHRLKGFLKALNDHPPVHHVFEFREPDWFREEIAGLLREQGAVFCRPDMPAFYHDLEIPDTAPLIYLRRHGPDPESRYAHSYSEEAVGQDARRIGDWLKLGKEVYLFYNNDKGGAAPRDAQRALAAVRQLAPRAQIS